MYLPSKFNIKLIGKNDRECIIKANTLYEIVPVNENFVIVRYFDESKLNQLNPNALVTDIIDCLVTEYCKSVKLITNNQVSI